MHSIPYTLRAVILAVLGFFFISLPTIVSAATYYINPSSGNDANVGTSTSVPWKTVNKANGVLVAGDTVYLMTGTYSGTSQRISPVNSGTAVAPITYARQTGATVTLSGTDRYITMTEKQYIVIQGPITFGPPTLDWGFLDNADNITIKDNVFNGANTARYSGLTLMNGSTGNRIITNTFQNWGRTDGTIANSWGDAVRLIADAGNNLIEGNNFFNAGHAGADIETSQNVIRNNYFKNAWWRGLLIQWVRDPSYHTLPELIAQYNVVDGNIFDSQGSQVTSRGGEAAQIATPYSIFRRNVFYNSRTAGLRILPTPDDGENGAPYTQGLRVYHNTFVHNGTSASVNEPGGFVLGNNSNTSVNVSNVHFKNNIFTGNTANTAQFWLALSPPASYGASYLNANYRIAGSCFSQQPNGRVHSLNEVQSISYYQTNYPTVFYGNDSSTPSFVNEAARDFHLNSGSGCIDRGVALTTTSSAGSGTSVPVVDALYFSDGKGLVSGDRITIGSEAVNITAVNYSTKILAIDRSISWSSGASVYYQTYSGTAPDAGAYEFVSAPSFNYSLSNSGTITATQGSSGSNTVTATLSSGTAQSVSYAASGLPTGATASFSQISCNPTCSATLTITTTASTPTGASTITVTGTPLSKTTSFTLTVTPPSDTTPPTVSLTAPANNATVSSTITVSANASDNIGISGVQFKLDGANLGTEDTTSPYSISWNTASTTNGSHALLAVARDQAGNTATNTGVSVTVSNGGSFSSILIEAENMSLISPMIIGNDTAASAGRYISATSGTDSTNPVAEGTTQISIPSTGTYYLWGRIKGPTNTTDALYLGIDNSWDRFFPSRTGVYEWVRIETSNGSGVYGFNLAAGTHTLRAGHSELNSRLDAVWITLNANATPPAPTPPS